MRLRLAGNTRKILVLTLLGVGAFAATYALVRVTGHSSRPVADSPPGMVWIPEGTFWRGSPKVREAQPQHQVTLDGFWIDQTAVTNEQFARFLY